MWKIILIVIAIVIYSWQSNDAISIDSNVGDTFSVEYDSSLSIKKPPIQNKINNSKISFQLDDYKVTPLANFQLIAKVLSEKYYRRGREAELSPVDLALGWGPMSKQENLNALTITQSGRWYRWRTDNFPIPRREIETNSANMHFIPANDIVKKKLKSIEKGDTIKLKGYLVQVVGEDGWRWNSSMTREDTGNHACELILLEDIKKL
ncbi:MAG: hypothetical protein HND53_07995 [Proteobacteria bacterium]|nr:hypothetical protein [Pseudomonadota bacterium]NOG60424.1 hypothetical protein [Pseudomonadota bacterium]